MLGNKFDDVKNRIINLTDAKVFAEKNKLKYFETSAKTGRNIYAVFESLILDLMEIYPIKDGLSPENITLNGKIVKKEKKCGCHNL